MRLLISRTEAAGCISKGIFVRLRPSDMDCGPTEAGFVSAAAGSDGWGATGHVEMGDIGGGGFSGRRPKIYLLLVPLARLRNTSQKISASRILIWGPNHHSSLAYRLRGTSLGLSYS